VAHLAQPVNYLEHGGARLFYTDEGDGPPVLLLHGWACDSHDWSWQIPALLPHYRVLALDQRGHGRSSAPEGSYRPQVLADDAAALLRACTDRPAVVVGHSMGTVVASALSVRHPHLVRALALIDPVYTAEDAVLAPVLEAIRRPNPTAVAAALFDQAFYTPATPDFLRTWHRRRLMGVPGHVLEGCLHGLYSGEHGIGRAAVASRYLLKRRHPRLAVYASDRSAAFERALPDAGQARIHVWEGAGHFLHQEQPDHLNRLLIDWLDGR
jgi:pimeloyl-ACP methyl ester carboxylesterase